MPKTGSSKASLAPFVNSCTSVVGCAPLRKVKSRRQLNDIKLSRFAISSLPENQDARFNIKPRKPYHAINHSFLAVPEVSSF